MTVRFAPRRSLADQLAAAMPAGIVRHRVTDRATWLALRRQDVTASVIAALVGEHPYTTRLGLYALKTGQIADSEVEAVITETSISLPPMLRGTVLEQVAPQLIAMLRPSWMVEPCGWYYRDPAARIGATPDFVAIDPDRAGLGVVQFKTTDSMMFGRVWRDEASAVTPPMFIIIQAVVEAVMTGASWAQVAVMVSGSTLDLHLIEIPLHDGIMARLRDEVSTFWAGIAAGRAPEADYGRDGEVLAALYRDDNGETLALDGSNALPALAAEDAELGAQMKAAKDRRDAIKAEVIATLGHHQAATIDGKVVVTAKTSHRGAYSVEATSFRQVRFKKGFAA